MNSSVHEIPLLNLSLAFVPVSIVIAVLYKWSHDYRTKLYAILRMLVQLLLIGYFLAYIFKSDQAWVVMAVLLVMLLISSWIALRSTGIPRRVLYSRAILSIMIGGGLTLALITLGVLQLHPWYRPSYLIPLGGMIFATAMNGMSLAAERVEAELQRGASYESARRMALKAALIPITNSLFAVGLVFLPGLMTGQILSGVPPLIAARYQIMVMCMTFSSAGLSSACFLMLIKSRVQNLNPGEHAAHGG